MSGIFDKIKSKLLILLSPIVIAGFFYFLMVPPLYIIIILIGIYTVLFLVPFSEKRLYKDDMIRAWDYAVKWWYSFRMENISTYNARAFHRYFGMGKYIAFVVNRGQKASSKSYQPLIFVVKVNDLSTASWDDNPTMEKLENPFIDISPIFTGSPDPTIRPELEPSLKYKQKLKKDLEETGVEEKEEKREVE